MSIEKTTLAEQHYLYVDREVEMNGDAISQAMGSGFGEVFGFAQAQGIVPQSMPITLYLEMPNGSNMKFRAGVFVSAADAAKASGSVSASKIGAGEAVKKTHVGPYANLNQSHKAIWDYCDTEGLTKGMPVWEIFVDDPTSVPEDKIRTEIYRAVS